MNVGEVIPYIATAVTGVVTYLGTRSKYKKDLEALEANTVSIQSDVVSKNLELYQNMIDDLEKRYKEKEENLDREIIELKGRNDELNHQIKKQAQFIEDLQDEREEERRDFEIQIKKLRDAING